MQPNAVMQLYAPICSYMQLYASICNYMQLYAVYQTRSCQASSHVVVVMGYHQQTYKGKDKGKDRVGVGAPPPCCAAGAENSCTSSVFILPQHAQLPGGAPGMPCGLRRSSRTARKRGRKGTGRGSKSVRKTSQKGSTGCRKGEFRGGL